MYKTKKRFLTLIEIMIVMFLIMMILGVVAYNYRGALDEGKAFKTKADIENILEFAVAQNPELLDDIEARWVDVVKKDQLVKNPAALTKDGWGEQYQVEVDDGKITVSSRKYEEYRKTHGTKF